MAASSLVMAPMPAATADRPRRTAVVMPSTCATFPTFAAGLVSIGWGVGSHQWTNALAVNMKATKAFGHGIPRPLEHST
jgi:hypothetical protein